MQHVLCWSPPAPGARGPRFSKLTEWPAWTVSLLPPARRARVSRFQPSHMPASESQRILDPALDSPPIAGASPPHKRTTSEPLDLQALRRTYATHPAGPVARADKELASPIPRIGQDQPGSVGMRRGSAPATTVTSTRSSQASQDSEPRPAELQALDRTYRHHPALSPNPSAKENSSKASPAASPAKASPAKAHRRTGSGGSHWTARWLSSKAGHASRPNGALQPTSISPNSLRRHEQNVDC